ncbi:hypothetical protein PANI_CDS0003 [Maribacter phage Panino]
MFVVLLIVRTITMILQLTKDGEDIIASDGQLKVDGRLGLYSCIVEVRERNDSFRKHFPHKIATGFRWNGRIIEVK